MSSPTPTSMFSSPSPLCSTSSTSHCSKDGTIFAKEMTVYQKNGTLFNVSQQNSMKLMVEVTKRFNELRRDVVAIQISRENDLFFSFNYQVDSGEFDKLQQAQQLSISFELFPEMLKSLLDKCASPNTTFVGNSSNDKSSHILCMEFVPRACMQLEIVERDKYQHIRRLAFTIPAASEEDIRDKYREIYQKFRRENEKLNGRVATLENDIRSLTQTNSELIQSYTRDLSSQEQSSQEKIREMERKYREDREKWLESERSLKARLSQLEFQVQSKDDALKCERQESGHSYSELKEKYSQELTRKNGRIKELEERSKQQNSELEYQKGLREKTTQALKKNELELDATKKDLSKANEIIRKLQEEVKSGREKLEILNQVTQKQEANLGVKECTLEKVSCEMKVSLQQLTKKKKELERVESELERCRSKCSQYELQIKANKAVIGRLNQQIEMQAKTIEKMKSHLEEDVKKGPGKWPQTVSSAFSTANSGCPVASNPPPANGGTQREVIHKKSAQSSKPLAGGRNVEFLLDDEAPKSRAGCGADALFDQEYNPKNHLFRHIKEERPQFKEVNLRTNYKAKSGNVMATKGRTHIL